MSSQLKWAFRPASTIRTMRLLSLLLLACSAGAQIYDPASQLATVNGQPILEGELDIRGEMIQLEQKAYQTRIAAIRTAIAARLLDIEAQRQGLDVEEMMETQVFVDIAAPTDLEVDAFYNAQKTRIRQPLEDVRPQVEALLLRIRQQEATTKFVEKLRETSNVKILVDPPRLKVDLTAAPMQGPSEAPVTIVEISDFQCPFCRRVQGTLGELQQKYGDQVRWSFKDLPLVSIHPDAQRAAEAARCAGDQGKFWEYRQAMFATSNINSDLHPKTADELGLNRDSFDECLDSQKYAEAVESDSAEAQSLGISGTPAFLINGILLSGAVPLESFIEVIDRELELAE